MDYGAGFKNGVLLFAVIAAVHTIMTHPEAVKAILCGPADETPPGRELYGVAGACGDSAAGGGGGEEELLHFVYSDEERGALDRFFEDDVEDARFAENAAVLEHAHLPQSCPEQEDLPQSCPEQEDLTFALDAFADSYACPV